MFQRQLSCVVVTNVGCSCHVLCCSFNAIFSHSEFNRLLTSTLQLSMLPQAHTDTHTHATTHTTNTDTHTTRHRHTYHQTRIHTHTYTHTYTHAYTHTDTHTQILTQTHRYHIDTGRHHL